MRSKHSYLGLSIIPRRIKGGHLKVEGEVEGMEKAKIVVVEDGEKKKKKFGKSKLKCYNCQMPGHYVDKFELFKMDKSKGKEKMHMAQKDEDEEEE